MMIVSRAIRRPPAKKKSLREKAPREKNMYRSVIVVVGVLIALQNCFAANSGGGAEKHLEYHPSTASEVGVVLSEEIKDEVTEKLDKIAEDFIASATAVSVYDGYGDVDLAMKCATKARKALRLAKKAGKTLELGEQYMSLGGAVADFQSLGLEKGSIAAYKRLSQRGSTRKWVKIGSLLGKFVAGVVWHLSEEPKAGKARKARARTVRRQLERSMQDFKAKPVIEAPDKKRKICVCSSPEVFFGGVCRKKVGVIDGFWVNFYCRKCLGFRTSNMVEFHQKSNGVVAYPGGLIPNDWDCKVYKSDELDELVLKGEIK